jgi:hypothetical protein
MRARNIKPGFFKNADLVELPMEARLLFAGLWCLADREGRLLDRPKHIKIEIFPGDDCNVSDLLASLAGAGFIDRYEVDGLRVIQVRQFTRHQRPHQREAPSELPAKPDQGATQAQPRQCPAALIPDSGFLIPDSGYLKTDSPAQPVLPEPEPRFSSDGPLDPKAWPPFLTTEWAFFFAGTQHSERDHARLRPFFAALIEEGQQPQTVLAKIRDPTRPKRQTTWEFSEWAGFSRKAKSNGRPSKRGH